MALQTPAWPRIAGRQWNLRARRSVMEEYRGKGGSPVQKTMAHPLALAASLLLALCVAGCGQVTSLGSGADAQKSSSQTAQAAAATPAVSGQVTLQLGKQRYGTDEPILVTIRNGLQKDIALTDGGAGCVSIEVERLVQGSWETVSQCAPAPAGRKSVVVSAGGAFVQRIDYAHEMDSGSGWPVGAYRAMLTYTPGGSGAAHAADAMVYSAEFTIG
jgi:hypothetical protein